MGGIFYKLVEEYLNTVNIYKILFNIWEQNCYFKNRGLDEQEARIFTKINQKSKTGPVFNESLTYLKKGENRTKIITAKNLKEHLPSFFTYWKLKYPTMCIPIDLYTIESYSSWKRNYLESLR